ncbi:MAG TPA: helix-turn-helix domain-containing protein [Acidimicrobiales bacterium]|nr:helix-turn-helix domain-containing protein [Acidimicrobiales bacterium]
MTDVVRRFTDQSKALARDVLAHCVEEVPFYQLLPSEQLHGEILEVIEENLRLLARGLSSDQVPTREELALVVASATRRAEEGVPLDAILAAYHVGIRVCWQTITADTTPENLPEVLAVTDNFFRYLQVLNTVVATAYHEERQAISGEEQNARQALASALLAGTPFGDQTAHLGVSLPKHFDVLCVAIGAHPDETDGGPGTAIAARRKLRRVLAELDQYSLQPVLSVLDPSGGVILLPCTSQTQPGPQPRRLIRRLGQAADAPVTAGAAIAIPDDTPTAARQAGEILDLVLRTGRPPGLYRLDDVLLEYHLTRPSDAICAIAALLEPLNPYPALLETLEAYIAAGLDRRATAAEMHIHPNTVDYRIHRATALTQLDPQQPEGLLHIAAALAIRGKGSVNP